MMKTTTLHFLTLTLVALSLTACTGRPDASLTPTASIAAGSQDAGSADAVQPPCCPTTQSVAADEAYTDESLYQHDAVWTDQAGRQIQLGSFQGEPVLMSMIFTQCGYACPLIVRDMKQVAARLPDTARERVRFVLVSMDPERDIPEALTRFAAAHDLDPGRWTLLTGDQVDVRVLAALLGVRYNREPDGQFSHTNLMAVLNEAGEIVHRTRGLGSDAAPAATALARLVGDERRVARVAFSRKDG
jgi:protein SCO1